jgi:hypothetical protein
VVASRPVPSAAACSTCRISPVARETSVPAAISADERSSPPPPFGFLGAACLRLVDCFNRSGDVSSIMCTIYDPRLARPKKPRDQSPRTNHTGAAAADPQALVRWRCSSHIAIKTGQEHPHIVQCEPGGQQVAGVADSHHGPLVVVAVAVGGPVGRDQSGLLIVPQRTSRGSGCRGQLTDRPDASRNGSAA